MIGASISLTADDQLLIRVGALTELLDIAVSLGYASYSEPDMVAIVADSSKVRPFSVCSATEALTGEHTPILVADKDDGVKLARGFREHFQPVTPCSLYELMPVLGQGKTLINGDLGLMISLSEYGGGTGLVNSLPSKIEPWFITQEALKSKDWWIHQ